MGQGIYTSIAMILAEELDADLSQVTLRACAAERQALRQSAFGIQVDRQLQLGPRVLEAAAQGRRQRARHAGAGRGAAMAGRAGELHDGERRGDRTPAAAASFPMARWRDAASKQTPPKDVPLKDPKDFKLIGKPLKRLDTPDKVNGKAVYGIDAMLPGHEVRDAGAVSGVRRQGRQGRRQRGQRRFRACGRSSCSTISSRSSAITCGRPRRASMRSTSTGTKARTPTLSSKDIWDDLRAASEKDGVVAKSDGDIAKGLATGDRLEAAYELPFLAHATMEPLNCTVHVKPDSLRDLGRHAGHGAGAVGGGEGRRPAGREGDRAQPPARRRLRPPARARHGGRGRAHRQAGRRAGEGGVDPRGRHPARHLSPGLSRHDLRRRCRTARSSAGNIAITGSSVIARWLPPAFQNGIDIDAVDSAVDMPYDIPNFHVEYVAGRAAGGADRLLARRRPEQQRVRDRKLHGRAGAQGRQGSGRVPPRHARQERRACWRRSIWRRRNPAGASRCRRASGAASACSRRSAASSRPWSKPKSTSRARCSLRRVTSRGRYRHRRQSRHHRGAARRAA